VVCGAPTFAYLTVFTDYEQAPDGAAVFRNLSRAVNRDTGETWDTPNSDESDLVASGIDPDLAAPGAFDESAYYEVGFEWHQESLRFFMGAGSAERTLWTLRGEEAIPQSPLRMMYNMWHPDSHWAPGVGAADYPANDVVLRVDWFEFTPE
jgi:hypothetical protein